MESDSGSVGATLARSQGLLWLLVFTLLGWGLAGIVQLRPEPPRLLFASRAADTNIECYGQSEVGIALVSRLDTEFDAGRMVLTVPVVDNKGDEGEGGYVLVVVPAGARTILVDKEGAVTVFARPLPPPVLEALLGGGASMTERIKDSKAALAALRSLPRIREFLMTP